MNLAARADADSTQILEQARRQAQETRDTMDKLPLDTSGCGDWVLLDRVEKLADRVR